MRGVMVFMMWLLSLWTRFREFLPVRRRKMHPLDSGRVHLRVGVEQLRSDEVEHESSLTSFLSSLPKDTWMFYKHVDHGFELAATTDDGRRKFSGDEVTRCEFVAAIASSKVECFRCFYFELDRKSMELKHIEEIVEALASNNNFKTVWLDFLGCTPLQMAECVSKMLLGNKAIKRLFVDLTSEEVVGREVAELLANSLHKNRSLKYLDLSKIMGLVDDDGMEVLIKPLKDDDSVLQQLCLGKITNVGLEHLGFMLVMNTSLETLEYRVVEREEMFVSGFTSLNKALCVNKSLKNLRCVVKCSMQLKLLLEPFMPMTINQQANTTLKTLHLFGSSMGGKEGMDTLTNMICTNTTLEYLNLSEVKELDDGNLDAMENVVTIMEVLKRNKSLKTLGMAFCGGVGGYKVLGTMMDMLLENHQLQYINVSNTPLERCGDAKYVHNELEKRKKMKAWELIKGMANVKPKSGRVFLCGNPRLGKTTLRISIKELREFDSCHPSQHSKRMSMKKMFTKTFGMSKIPKVLETKPEIERTQGIEVDHVECDGIGISIWDMAGQTDYHSFHDLVIPNLSADGSCSLFLLTCNPMQENSLEARNILAIETELKYWLRFIASNTRRSWQYRPHVSIVMTHYDHWHTNVDFQSRIEDIVVELKMEFEEVLEFDLERKMFMVDGGEESCARMVFDFMKRHLKQLLTRLPMTIKACTEVQRLIANWNQGMSKQVLSGETSKIPMLKWEEFSIEICKGVEELQDRDIELARRKQEFVAISLNDGGHIMYHEEGKFIITNPHWFCHDIMGGFLHRCANMDAKLEIVSIHGIISIEHVKQVLMKIMGGKGHENMLDATLDMMKKLQMCYEQDDKSIMIPSMLKDKRERLCWHTMPQRKKLTYVGRRLSCKDGKRTMLSLGFFPRLQVSFFQKFQNNNVGNSYRLFKDVIMFIRNGIEVIIEFDSVDIDIMLRSELCQDKMLEFLENDIVRYIQDLLKNPTLGCPGVILVEHILRPKCVEELVGMEDRKDQFVSIEELELEVITSGFDATHNWKQCGHVEISYDKVKDLVGSRVWMKKFLEERQKDLERYQNQILQMSHKNLQGDSICSKSGMDDTWRSTMWQTVQKTISIFKLNRPNLHANEMTTKLDNIDEKLDVVIRKVDVVIRKVDDIMQMQENIVKMQDNLLLEVSSRIKDLMELSIEMQQSKIPKLAYLSEVGHKTLLTRFVLGLVELELHLLCESRDGIHEVVDQEGCKVSFGTSDTRAFVTMLVWGLKVATILTKIGAHVAGGMGGMVPDFGDGLQLAGLILDTPGLMDEMSASCLKSLPNNISGSPRITRDDRSKAEEFLVGVLEPKCKEESTFYQMFKLRKVVYKRENSGEGSVAWLCNRCRKNGMESRVLYND